ncbi:MAG: 4Fe-4S binding protein [Candidatus Izemoplasmatales bacterium]|nr:4Fe-4S binding protein [Candidatus Izemoplasmatales bacterium]
MNIGFISGKGGTGKTYLSVNLAARVKGSLYLDCDCEEPNGHLFFRPSIDKRHIVNVCGVSIDSNRCDGCHQCVDFCVYNALAMARNKAMVFPDLCHGCGGCIRICPMGAIEEKPQSIGVIMQGHHDDHGVISGFLDPGKESAVMIIRHLFSLARTWGDGYCFVDCPPGNGCQVMECVHHSDYVVIVAEPSIFGLSNLKMTVRLTESMDKRAAVIINKSMGDDDLIVDYCREHHLPLVGTMPFDRTLAHMNNEAKIAVDESIEYAQVFDDIWARLKSEIER